MTRMQGAREDLLSILGEREKGMDVRAQNGMLNLLLYIW